ncbi:MAG: ribonuclease J [Candidatus Poribacteria bacterium]|nr:MAG: ribonuclease J [Candidatus Poribacteria bacterium]
MSDSESRLSLIPLGGLGEFGMNSLLLEYGDSALLIDAGMMFPEPNMFGVDFVLPDFSYLRRMRTTLRGIVLTHGHEDHAGAIAHVLQHVSAPVFGSDLTLELARSRLQEYGLHLDADLRRVQSGSVISLGPFRVEFLSVSHSIPGTFALAIHTPAGVIVHTADFKVDTTPQATGTFEIGRLAELGNRGVLLLLSDSTNAEVPGWTPPERSIRPKLEELFHRTRGRLIAATFASSLYRIQQLIELAAEHGRYIAFTGRSLVENVKVASELGYLWLPANLTVDVRKVNELPPEKVLLLTTGSQGEAFSALWLLGNGSHPHLSIQEGDTVVISARVIPGHEKEVAALANHLSRRGAEVLYGNQSGIHVSGHGSQEDLRMMLALTRPRYFIPIHGEYRQLRQHARLAAEMAIPSENILLIEDGQRVEVTPERCEVVGEVPIGRVLVDGRLLEGLDEVVLRDRRQLSRDGMVIVVVVLNRQTGEIEGGPDIVTRGFLAAEDEKTLLDEARNQVRAVLRSLNSEELADEETVQESIRLALRRYFKRTTDRRPILVPIVLDV